MFRNFKISTIIITAFLFVAIFGTISGTIYFYLDANKIIKKDVFNHLETTAQSRAEHIETYFKQNIERLKLITSKTWLRQNLKDYKENPSEELKDNITNIIIDSKKPIEEFERICVIGLDGKVIASTDSSFFGRDVHDKDFFINGKKENRIYFVNEDGKSKILVSGPFFLDEELLGVGITVVSIDVLGGIVKDRTGLGKTGEVLVAMQGKTERTYFLERLFEVEALNQDIASEATAEPIKQALLGNELIFENTLDYRDKEVIAVSQYVEIGKMGLVAKIDTDEVLGTAQRELIKTSLIIIIFLTIIIGLIGFFISRLITKPIFILEQGIKIIEEGNLKHKVVVGSKNEIGQLAEDFNQMTDKLQEARANIEKKVVDRTAEFEKLNQAMTGRELKMVELKKEIIDLKNQLKK